MLEERVVAAGFRLARLLQKIFKDDRKHSKLLRQIELVDQI